MARRGRMQAVLANFLATFTSRHADHRGYWVLGQVPLTSWSSVIDLLGEPPPGVTPVEAARRLAIERFRGQLQKVGLPRDRVAAATLDVVPRSTAVRGSQGDFAAEGRELRFTARASLSDGRRYVCERTVFVAPHDPAKERRRAPEHWGA